MKRVVVYLLFCAIVAFTGVVAVNMLPSSSSADRSTGGVCLAFAVFFAVMLVTLELARRGASQRAQWVTTAIALGGAAAVLIVVGITGEDAGKLAMYGTICSLVALGSAAGGGRSRS